MNQDRVKACIDEFSEFIQKKKSKLIESLNTLTALRADPKIVDRIRINNNGIMSPVSHVATINQESNTQISVRVWNKSQAHLVEKSLVEADLPFTMHNDRDGRIILSLPQMSTEKRQLLAKKIKEEGEHFKIILRNHRREIREEIRHMRGVSLSEDDYYRFLEQIDNHTHDFDQYINSKVAEYAGRVTNVYST